MATETTKDAVIVVPAEQASQVKTTETVNGTVVQFTSTTSDVNVDVTGNVVSTGSTIKNSTFTFTEQGSLAFENKVVGSKVNATVGNDSVGFGGEVKDTKTQLGDGRDSVAFGGGGKVKDVRVSMGAGDNVKDVTTVEKLKDVKSLKLTNFGKEDKLVVNGKTFGFNDLQNKDFSGRIIVKFD